MRSIKICVGGGIVTLLVGIAALAATHFFQPATPRIFTLDLPEYHYEVIKEGSESEAEHWLEREIGEEIDLVEVAPETFWRLKPEFVYLFISYGQEGVSIDHYAQVGERWFLPWTTVNYPVLSPHLVNKVKLEGERMTLFLERDWRTTSFIGVSVLLAALYVGLLLFWKKDQSRLSQVCQYLFLGISVSELLIFIFNISRTILGSSSLIVLLGALGLTLILSMIFVVPKIG